MSCFSGKARASQKRKPISNRCGFEKRSNTADKDSPLMMGLTIKRLYRKRVFLCGPFAPTCCLKANRYRASLKARCLKGHRTLVLKRIHREKTTFLKNLESGAPGEIRTPDLLVRSQTLYPTELRAHMVKAENELRKLWYLKERFLQSFFLFPYLKHVKNAPSTVTSCLQRESFKQFPQSKCFY
jgi:hypothetical protein